MERLCADPTSRCAVRGLELRLVQGGRKGSLYPASLETVGTGVAWPRVLRGAVGLPARARGRAKICVYTELSEVCGSCAFVVWHGSPAPVSLVVVSRYGPGVPGRGMTSKAERQ